MFQKQADHTRSAEFEVPIIAVDYGNIDALAETREEHKIHTVISTLTMMPSPSGDLPKEVELIQAADKSSVTKRFISSDWGVPHSKELVQTSSLAAD